MLTAHIGISYERKTSINDLDSATLSRLESSEEIKSIQEAWNILQFATQLHKEYVNLKSVETADAEVLLSRTENLYIKVNG